MAKMDWEQLDIVEISTDQIAEKNGDESLNSGEQHLNQLARIFSKAFERRHSKNRSTNFDSSEEGMAA